METVTLDQVEVTPTRGLNELMPQLKLPPEGVHDGALTELMEALRATNELSFLARALAV